MAGRTNSKWLRVYVDGYDLSGDARQIGPLGLTYDEAELTGMSNAIKGYLPSHASVSAGTLNAVLDNTATTGIHEVMSGAGVMRTLMVAVGMRAEPAQGDPAFMGQFEQEGYGKEVSGGVYVNIPFNSYSIRAATLSYENPWGVLLRPKTATTAVNSAVGVDDYGASTAFGGYMSYQVFAGNGTATIKVQHAAANNDGSFADLGGCTSGSIDCSTVKYGIVPTTARTTTVNRYIRWQIALGTATSVTFALAFHRALR